MILAGNNSVAYYQYIINTRIKILSICIKRLCIFGPKGAIQMRYYYLTFFNLPRPTAATATATTTATA